MSLTCGTHPEEKALSLPLTRGTKLKNKTLNFYLPSLSLSPDHHDALRRACDQQA